MQGQHLYEYAVIRLVPRVEREEFLNIGVVLYCAKEKFLSAQLLLDEARMTAFGGDVALEDIKAYAASFACICDGKRPAGGPIAQLPPAERFRWLTATRSTVIQTSKVHPGFCTDARATLSRLFDELVAL
jgi:hypothetical protein